MECPYYAALTAAGADPLGFYDAHNQIILVPSADAPPSVVVEHELTHVNLVNNSVVGLLERMLHFAGSIWILHDPGEQAAWPAALAKTVRTICGPVHEAIAWYGTEEYTSGRENMTAPPELAGYVGQIRDVLDHRGLSRVVAGSDSTSCLAVAEEAGSYALNAPIFDDPLWGEPRLITPAALRQLLTRPANDPLRRFTAVLKWLGSLPTDDIVRWELQRRPGNDAQDGDMIPTWPGQIRRRRPVPETRLETITLAYIADLTERMFRYHGLFAAGRPQEWPVERTREAIRDLWSTARIVDRVDGEVDRYAQVCVLRPPTSAKAQLANTGDTEPSALRGAPLLLVGLEAPGRQWHSYSVPMIGYASVRDIESPSGPAWIAPIPRIRRLLAELPATTRVIAQSMNYDFTAGELGAEPILDGRPHVVMATTDFRALWVRIVAGGGIAGHPEVQWHVLPSPAFGTEYGYLLLRSKDAPSPVIIQPIVRTWTKRILDFAARTEGGAVTLEPMAGDREQWLGGLARHVMDAIAKFEGWTAPTI